MRVPGLGLTRAGEWSPDLCIAEEGSRMGGKRSGVLGIPWWSSG